MRKDFLVAAVVLVFTSVACNFSLGGAGASSDVLLQDDFSDTGSGWTRASEDIGTSDYQNGGYHIFVSSENSYVWTNPGKNFSDVRIEADAHKLSGVDDNEYGVLCRIEDSDNFYGGVISSDGYYGFVKVSGGNFEYLRENLQTSDVIEQGEAINHIRLDCVGSTLTLYINGEMLGTATDEAFTSGDVGLYAGTFGTPNIDIFFDNFVVRRP